MSVVAYCVVNIDTIHCVAADAVCLLSNNGADVMLQKFPECSLVRTKTSTLNCTTIRL